MFKIADYTNRIEQIKRKIIEQGIELPKDTDDSLIHIVFVGQYSSGKSTIMKMLTENDDIQIGEEITTQHLSRFKWNGLEIIDTPGIHTTLRPDHDLISYEAIASADMLVFVISNELFDSHMAEHFRKLAIDKDKAGEMILVVNKMTRTAQGNTLEQQEIIKKDLENVLKPYTPEQLHISFLDAESYVDGLSEKDNDPEIANELINRSGYSTFIKTLNEFVEEKGIQSKLTTQLYVLEKKLEDEIKDVLPKAEDDDINALEESFVQQKYLLIEERGRIYQEVKDISMTAASKIRNIGLDAANLLYEGCKQDEVENQLDTYARDVENITQICQVDIQNVINKRLYEINRQLDNIENSTFSTELKLRLNGKITKFPENIQKTILHTGKNMQRVGQTIVKNAYKTGVDRGLKLTNFSGGEVHELILKFGEKISYKFKPWEALKITKGIAIGGKILNVIGVGLDVFMQIKADVDEDKVKADLRKNRTVIRGQFCSVANDLEDYIEEYINKNVIENLDKSIKELENSIQEIRNSRTSRSDRCKSLQDIQTECVKLISDIHLENK